MYKDINDKLEQLYRFYELKRDSLSKTKFTDSKKENFRWLIILL